MALIHVLGGLSLPILVVVSTMVRAGIGFEHGDVADCRKEVEAEGNTAKVVADPVPGQALAPGSLKLRPLLDRTRH